MTAVELKKLQVHRIAEIKSQSQILMLTKEQRIEITESKKQVEQGQFIEQEEMDKEFTKWLSEK
jgi:hypothetical protein